MRSKNTYIKNYKKGDALKEAMKSENFFVYDQVMKDKQGMGDQGGDLTSGNDRATKLWQKERKVRELPRREMAKKT